MFFSHLQLLTALHVAHVNFFPKGRQVSFAPAAFNIAMNVPYSHDNASTLASTCFNKIVIYFLGVLGVQFFHRQHAMYHMSLVAMVLVVTLVLSKQDFLTRSRRILLRKL